MKKYGILFLTVLLCSALLCACGNTDSTSSSRPSVKPSTATAPTTTPSTGNTTPSSVPEQTEEPGSGMVGQDGMIGSDGTINGDRSDTEIGSTTPGTDSTEGGSMAGKSRNNMGTLY